MHIAKWQQWEKQQSHLNTEKVFIERGKIAKPFENGSYPETGKTTNPLLEKNVITPGVLYVSTSWWQEARIFCFHFLLIQGAPKTCPMAISSLNLFWTSNLTFYRCFGIRMIEMVSIKNLKCLKNVDM